MFYGLLATFVEETRSGYKPLGDWRYYSAWWSLWFRN